MSFDQIFLFGLFIAVFVFLIWGRFRYDLVAFAALIVAVIVGVVPKTEALRRLRPSRDNHRRASFW